MPDQNHLEIFLQGADAWCSFLEANPELTPDLSNADLRDVQLEDRSLFRVNLSGALLSGVFGSVFVETNLSGADLSGSILLGASFVGANLSGANLAGATLTGADFAEANLSGADLHNATLAQCYLVDASLGGAKLTAANLSTANLTRTDLSGADLTGADLSGAIMVGTNLSGTRMKGTRIYGASAWDLIGVPVDSSLLITPADEATVEVEHPEVAQFMYRLLNTSKSSLAGPVAEVAKALAGLRTDSEPDRTGGQTA